MLRTPPDTLPRHLHCHLVAALSLLLSLPALTFAVVQDPVTGAFEGTVTNRQGGAAITGAIVQFINTMTEVPVAKRSDAQGRFYQGLLPPGVYRIRVSAAGFKTTIVEQRLLATRPNSVVPVPVVLEPEVAVTLPPPPTNSPGTTPPPPSDIYATARDCCARSESF